MSKVIARISRVVSVRTLSCVPVPLLLSLLPPLCSRGRRRLPASRTPASELSANRVVAQRECLVGRPSTPGIRSQLGLGLSPALVAMAALQWGGRPISSSAPGWGGRGEPRALCEPGGGA